MKKENLLEIVMCVALIAGCSKTPTENEGGNGVNQENIPSLPTDPQPNSTSFSHRLLIIQHTGTYCSNCPLMMNVLKELAEDSEYNTLYNHVACHSYNDTGDAAYSDAAKKISDAYCSGYYPELTYNLTKTASPSNISDVKAKLDALKKDTADAGIAVATNVVSDTIYINAEIKAAVENNYRIAAWVIEDNIKSTQTGATESWQHIHNNALRSMAGSALNMRIYGERLGTLAAGEKASKTFAIPVESSWNTTNCEILVLVNSADDYGNFDVANSVVCPVGESIDYQYINE